MQARQILAITLTLAGSAFAQAENTAPNLDTPVVRIGPGGFLTSPPKPCKPLPEKIYKTDDLTGPMLTNQWWSSLVWQQYSQPMFAHPLVMTATAQGLVIAQHGKTLTANAAAIFGSGSGKSGDLRLGHTKADHFPQADCAGWSDWFVTTSFAIDKTSLRASFGHGSPFVFALYTGGDPKITFANQPKIFAGSANDAVLGVTINGNHYALFGATGSKWTGLDTSTFINHAGGKDYFSLAVLPDDKPETLALFRKHAYAHVTDTRVDYRIDGGTVRASYQFTLKAYEGTLSETLFALYPHQWKYTSSKLTAMTYGSVRGEMKVGTGKSFETAVPIQGVLPMFPREGAPDRDRLVNYLKAEASKKPGGHGDTYWEGKRLGRLATLSGIAESLGETALRDGFVSEIKQRLESWFTATPGSPGKDQPVFYYNRNWGTLIGSKPSYGSDLPLNDHHFHYGYFIRAAAEVARVEPAWAAKWAPMVELVIRDIASLDRKDAMFPFMRCYDKYAGHSWASGDANFADGNNQESSSESLNAWYGMILWGEATKNVKLRDAGLFLFNTERTAVEEYWFDVSGTNYPRSFPNVALGMVWGGKGAFGTWFSADIDCIHGINWLPFTPASIAMGRFPDYVKKNHDRIVEKRKGGSDYNNGWGDLVIMFYALSDPAAAAKYIDANPNCKLEGGNSHAFMYHWIHTLSTLGINDAKVTADYPISNIFLKDGVRTYVVYNFQATPLTVTFSDGFKLLAEPSKLTVAPSR
ncbi:MAG: glycosyl hydrolase [Phycisphaeraceae bacterium]